MRVYPELQSKQRAAYGDDEAAREAAGKAALLRAKESLSTGWRARLCCKQRGRLAAASSQLRGVCQLARPKSARERESHEREIRVSECAYAASEDNVIRVSPLRSTRRLIVYRQSCFS